MAMSQLQNLRAADQAARRLLNGYVSMGCGDLANRGN